MGLNLVSNDQVGTDLYPTSVESLLSFADGELITDLRDRLKMALRYTFSWQQAITPGAGVVLETAAGSYDPIAAAGFLSRISDMQAALNALLNMMLPSDVFPGNDIVSQYNAVSAAWAQLYRDLALSLTGQPQRALLDQLGDLGSAFINAPVAAAKSLAQDLTDAIARLLGNTAGAIWSNLWPWLLVAGALGIAYVFRAPLMRAIGKVAK
jgi:hypothetical protein